MPDFNSKGREEKERIVMHLLKQPALNYIRELDKTLQSDSEFLIFHQASIGLRIQGFLLKDGAYFDQEILKKEMPKIVWEAIVRLRSVEK